MFVTPLRCAWLWQARNEALGLLCNLSLRRGNRAQMSSQRLLDDLLPFMVLPHRRAALAPRGNDGSRAGTIGRSPLRRCRCASCGEGVAL